MWSCCLMNGANAQEWPPGNQGSEMDWRRKGGEKILAKDSEERERKGRKKERKEAINNKHKRREREGKKRVKDERARRGANRERVE